MEKFGIRELEFNRWLYLFGGGATRDPRQGQPGLTAAQCPVPLQTWRDSGRLSGRALRGGGRSATAAGVGSHSRPRGESSFLFVSRSEAGRSAKYSFSQ